jgi:hypothetical protein
MKQERISIIREPDDNLDDVRIFLGRKKNWGMYLVFRGNPTETLELLETALAEAKTRLPDKNYTDHRGRSQG